MQQLNDTKVEIAKTIFLKIRILFKITRQTITTSLSISCIYFNDIDAHKESQI